MNALEHRLDIELPTWRRIAAEPNWARWLNACNPADGRLRSEQFGDAVRQGDAGHVITMLQRYVQEQREGWPIREVSRGHPRHRKPTYSREDIRRTYERRRRGEISDADFNRWESDVIAAAREGRVENPCPLARNYGDGR
jgi:hypothetical protein